MTFTGTFLLIMALISSFAFGVFVEKLISPREEEPTDIESLKGKDISVFAKLDPNRSIFDRIDLFLARSLGFERRLEETYMLLGRPSNTDPLKMLHFKEILAAAIPVVLYFPLKSFIVLAFIPIGFYLPELIYYARIKKRQDDIIRNFPTFVDLSALMIESGLDYMTSFDRIVKIAPKKTFLEVEIETTINEVQLGYSRRDSLRRFTLRTGLQEIRSFVGLIIQSDELGTSLVELLRNYSADMRFRRLNRAEKLAAQASTKMLIPLFIFIFPVVFILILSPMVFDLIKGGGLPF
ncbi:MAG: type II secretion system F family protein [Elusimicrobiota bacterium]